jgi:hypothetical protein
MMASQLSSLQVLQLQTKEKFEVGERERDSQIK